MNFSKIGTIESCFKEKFGIPRQAGLVPEARGRLLLFDFPGVEDTIRGLENFSHIWVLFVFHGIEGGQWNPLVRPPRLGGEQKVGVFASRSPHRPNPIGLSAIELEGISSDPKTGLPVLLLKGLDLLDGTPVLDIKPYIPYSDSIPGARSGWAASPPEAKWKVEFSERAASFCTEAEGAGYPRLRELVTQVLALDPRPAFQTKGAAKIAETEYGMRLLDFDVHWRVELGRCLVTYVDDLRKRD